MVFALETFWPASDGWSAARIEEQLIVTPTGCEVITRFPAEELLVAGGRYYTATGPLNTVRDAQSHRNTVAGRGEHAAANGHSSHAQASHAAHASKPSAPKSR